MSRHVVLFAPNYLYLNLPVFQPVMSCLAEMGLKPVMLDLPGNLKLPQTSDSVYPKHAYCKLPLKLEQGYEKNVPRKALLLIKLLWNYRLIMAFVQNKRPSAVVVGSDLGNVHIRFLLDACRKNHIPVFVLYNCDVPGRLEESTPKHIHFCIQQLFCKPGRFRFFRAVFFQGHIPGTYHQNSIVCVMSDTVRSKLIQHGINPARIVVTGMPAAENHSIERKVFLKEVDIPAQGRIIVFCSGPLGEVFGLSREIAVLNSVRRMIDSLPQDVFLIIKLHPRETPDYEAMLHQMFNSNRCRIIRDMSAERMIPHVDLLIGDFSRVLITAAEMGKRFFSIIPWHDTRSLLNRMEADFLEIVILETLAKKVLRALNDPEYQTKMNEACRSMAERYTSKSEKDPVKTIASLIYNDMKPPTS